MRDLTYFVGGSVGSDPYGTTTWSGVSMHLLRAMEEAGLLHKAVGVRPSKSMKYWLHAHNFSPKRNVWRQNYCLDLKHRHALTRAAGTIPVESIYCLQVGSMFCLPTVRPDKICASYSDGNLAQSLNSNIPMAGVSPKRLDQALRYEEETSQQMSAVFTFSEYLRQSFIHDYHVPEDRVFNVGGAVNLSEIPFVDEHKDWSTPRILFIGVDFVRKGGPQLLQAFARVRESIPNAELHIVGPDTVDYLPAGAICHGYLSKSNLGHRQRLEFLFRDCTLLALPSLYEPFGIAPLEAMLYQLPCVVTDGWALREFVTPGFNGELVEKGSIEDLTAKLIQCLSDPVAMQAMGKRGREIALRRYTWPAVVGRISQALRSL